MNSTWLGETKNAVEAGPRVVLTSMYRGDPSASNDLTSYPAESPSITATWTIRSARSGRPALVKVSASCLSTSRSPTSPRLEWSCEHPDPGELPASSRRIGPCRGHRVVTRRASRSSIAVLFGLRLADSGSRSMGLSRFPASRESHWAGAKVASQGRCKSTDAAPSLECRLVLQPHLA